MLLQTFVLILLFAWCSMHAAELRGSSNRETDSVIIEEKVSDTLDVAMNTFKELDVATIQVGKRKLDEGSSIDVDTLTNVNWGGHKYQDDAYAYDDYYYDDYNDDGYYYDDNQYNDDGYYYDDYQYNDDGYYYDDYQYNDDGYYYDDVNDDYYYYDDTHHP